jgi:hypothetical protein
VKVFELYYPGALPDALPVEDAMQVRSLFAVLETHLADSAVGLWLFEQALDELLRSPLESRRRAEDEHAEITRALMEMPEVQAAEKTLSHELQADKITSKQWSKAHADIRDAADLQARRQQWANGQMPGAYRQRLPHLYAHTVLYALDGIRKALYALTQISGLPTGVAAAYQAHAAALPGLTAVRNSAQHIEDRARRRGPGNSTITPQSVTNQAIHAPTGNVLVMGMLSGNRLAYTASDGNYREVEISALTIRTAQDAIQAAINAITWRGSGQTAPL